MSEADEGGPTYYECRVPSSGKIWIGKRTQHSRSEALHGRLVYYIEFQGGITFPIPPKHLTLLDGIHYKVSEAPEPEDIVEILIRD